MYATVPTPTVSPASSSHVVHEPKSVSFALTGASRERSKTRTFAGFTSRWTTPFRWRYSSPRRTSAMAFILNS